MKLHKPKSIEEAIGDLQVFLESDLYTLFRPEQNIPGDKRKWYREDSFPDEKAFLKYLDDHFNILRKQIIKLIGNKKFQEELSHKTGGKE